MSSTMDTLSSTTGTLSDGLRRGARTALCAGALCGAAAWAGCGASEPAASTEALEETAPSPTPPAEEIVSAPAHAALPAWVPSTLHESVAGSRLPVMLPHPPATGADPAVTELPRALASAEVLHMDRWVSTRIETSTYAAVIAGTDAHHEPPRGASFDLPEPDRTLRGAPGYAYENEGLYYAQWQEDGIAWDVEVDCLGGSCDGVAIATAIAECLESVGGVR